jgi:heterodisulfide reductase subunit A2
MSQNKNIVIIGAGPAGLEAASCLSHSGHRITIVEKEAKIGGKLNNWHHLFPDLSPASKVTTYLENGIKSGNNEFLTEATANSICRTNGNFQINLSNERYLDADAVLISAGFKIFNAERKEEYGYSIYKNVMTSAEFEEALATGNQIKALKSKKNAKIGFIHCVGSRDKKCGNIYCSKVCCITGVKQAIQLKQLNPDCQVFNFYMDLRMYGQNFEELYLEAQQTHGITFIRGRISEIAENIDDTLQIKAEDTLSGRPIKMNFDLIILLVGMEPSTGLKELGESVNLSFNTSGFLSAVNSHLHPQETTVPGIFIAGTCREPLSIQETLTDARAAAAKILFWLEQTSK